MDCWMKIRKWQLVYKLDSRRELVREEREVTRERERERISKRTRKREMGAKRIKLYQNRKAREKNIQ